jgi:integrase/recombinase XerD
MATYKIILRPDATGKNGKSPIWLQVFLTGQRLRLPLGVSVEDKYFDGVRMSVKKIPDNKALTDTLNAIISKAKSKCDRIFSESVLYGAKLTKDYFLSEYNADTVSKKSFTAFFEKSITLETDKAYNTLRAYKSTFNYWKQFKLDVSFGDLTYEYVDAFDKFLRKKGVKEVNTLSKHHKHIKKFINLAIAKGHKFENPYKNFKTTTTENEMEYLTLDELNKFIELYEAKSLEYGLQKVLRYYLFSATCNGLRYSDVAQITPEEVHGDMLVFTPIKTQRLKKALTVPLSKYGKRLIAEALADRQRVRKTIFTVISNQKTNVALKKIAAIVGLKKDISFHSARHTFATVFLAKNKNLVTLQKLMGHSSIKTTSKYAHISHEQKVEEMKNFDELFNF